MAKAKPKTKARESAKTVDLKKLVDSINAGLKRSIVSTGAAGILSEVKGHIPTGSTLLDVGLGGGWPLGRLVEIFGKPGSGKSCLLTYALGAVQRMGGIAILLDTESGFETEFARKLGCDPEKIVYMDPEVLLEEVFSEIKRVIESTAADYPNTPTLIVWDSLAQTPCGKDIDDESMEPKRIGAYRAAIIKRGLRKLIPHPLSGTHICFAVTNHVYEVMTAAIPYSETPGGLGLKHNLSIRLQLKHRGYLKAEGSGLGDTPGSMTEARFDKNKLTSAQRLKFPLRFIRGEGFVDSWSVFDYATEVGIIRKEGMTERKSFLWTPTAGGQGVKFYSKQYEERLVSVEEYYTDLCSQVAEHFRARL